VKGGGYWGEGPLSLGEKFGGGNWGNKKKPTKGQRQLVKGGETRKKGRREIWKSDGQTSFEQGKKLREGKRGEKKSTGSKKEVHKTLKGPYFFYQSIVQKRKSQGKIGFPRWESERKQGGVNSEVCTWGIPTPNSKKGGAGGNQKRTRSFPRCKGKWGLRGGHWWPNKEGKGKKRNREEGLSRNVGRRENGKKHAKRQP